VKKLGSLAGCLDGCRMLSQRRQWSKACAGAGGVTGKSLADRAGMLWSSHKEQY